MLRTLVLLPFLTLSAFSRQDAPPTPEEHLDRPVGRDFELADWGEVSSYHLRLAETSPNVKVEVLGKTQEGRDFLQTIVSSPENLARLGDLRGLNKRLADPRGHDEAALEEALRDGRTFLVVSPGMHSSETSPAQFGLEFVHRLATSNEEPWRTAREELVVVVFPCTNPDGLDHVVSWYREHVGTPYEATGLDRLYQLYAGHDNNRDWFMLSLAETRLVTEQLYRSWRPQVYWDVHEQGSTRERFFVPPFRDPLDPNIDPLVVTGIDLLGTRALHDMSRAGLTGIATGVGYDMWWNGGNRSVPARHNVLGLLTEAAGVRGATPLFLPRSELSSPRGLSGDYEPSNRFPAPWPGGWWRMRDVLDYELGFGRSLVGSLGREPRQWRELSLQLAQRALAQGKDEGPSAWLIPPGDNPDVAAVRRLTQVLLSSGIELHLAGEDFELDGRPWPAGTIVARRDQPYGPHLKDLFEVQRYPEGDSPYDVSGWTLPLLLGVHRVEVMQSPDGLALTPVKVANDALVAFQGDARVGGIPRGWRSARDGDSWSAVFSALDRGSAQTWVGAGERAGLFLTGAGGANTDEDPTVIQSVPRVGLYAPWSGSMPEGWARWVFDRFQLPYSRVRNENLRAGALGNWLDVLILPGVSSRQLDGGRGAGSAPAQLTGGLDPEGAVAVEEFVRGGGTVIALGSSSRWAAELFRLPLADTTSEAEDFSCPGSVVRCVPEQASWTAGLPPSVSVFFARSSAWRILKGDEAEQAGRDGEQPIEVLLRYAPQRVLLSGWIQGEAAIEGRAAWVRAEYGQGAVHLFGFRPQYRSWSQGAFHLLFRAVMLR